MFAGLEAFDCDGSVVSRDVEHCLVSVSEVFRVSDVSILSALKLEVNNYFEKNI